MNRRKELAQAYKEREIIGGIYIIKNSRTGRYLLDHTANLQGARNHFQFAVSTGSTVHPRLQRDWQALGPQAFTFTVLEELKRQAKQSSESFLDDLKTLTEMWRANLDPALSY
ncbi:GIY-YIG nuclease family protein [Dictyobacter aurantiacus]|uniref:GIY-YIG domain-containing protein n=1 Tax=Dictyobacter aurantiacus TaxID=1936993 RepID=A0A401ZKJ0_9CHLR|nr:GIY-YIG nuclease family protein [Dictyobacter aurantiacus]GCE07348.1 hypothetical protein KDAU_46770 [Dictyobacter aurantiacus]